MKKIFWSFAALVLVLSAVSCNKDKNSDTYFRCKINGETFEAVDLLAYAVDFSSSKTFYGVKDQSGTETCYINVPSDAQPGTYVLNAGDYNAYYIDAANTSFSTRWGASEGTLTIEEIDADHAKGTFQFIAYDSDTESIKRTASEGEFNVKFR